MAQEKPRLIVVSNRLPVALRREDETWRAEPSSGGLATAMHPILKDYGGVWIGWSGEPVEIPRETRDSLLAGTAEGFRYVAVDMDPALGSAFYEGYPNQTVWPVFHFLPSKLRFESGSWEAFVEGTRRFRDAVVAEARPGDLIWVHDYHLMLLPEMLRRALPDARIGFFLHIPFPSSEVFSILPRREEVLAGLLGADLIAFQTHRDVHHFRSALLRVSGMASGINMVEYGARSVRVEAMPIGIAAATFEDLLTSDPATARNYADLEQRYQGQQVIVAVDRMDYTKGIPQRLTALQRLLTQYPSLAGKVVLIQVAVPSREGIDTYQDLRDEVNQLVGQINGKLGAADWAPLVYVNRGIERAELAALYKRADVACVTPLRDGMNLVAKEYCTCKPGGDGVLVLSEFAGAAAELGEAFLVNPYDEERVADALMRALSLEDPERRLRMRAMHNRVVRRDVFRWAEGFLSALCSLPQANGEGTAPKWAAAAEIRPQYGAAASRMLFLDYDGTLVPFARRPEQAAPPSAIRDLLGSLCADRANTVALLSGRRSADLERWFGDIERLTLGAEHGALIRRGGSPEWAPLRQGPHSTAWKEQLRPILEDFVDRTPGSLIEEKEYSLVWHYRMVEPEFGEWLAGELVGVLEGTLADTELVPVRGHKIVEVKPVWANKGEFVQQLLNSSPAAGFRLAAGDDRTDEDMFARMPADSITLKVGGGTTRAQFRVPDPAALVQLLARLRGSIQ